MENLKDFLWSTRYSSATHDLIHDFFIPALARSKNYYRIAGYFSSTAIAAAMKGISAFVENGEKMYLVVGGEISEEDAMAINNGIINIDSILEKKWDEFKKDFEKDFIGKRFELLSWLIANNKLEIRIGVNKDAQGRYLPSRTSKFHEKILIFEDYEGNMIQVDGSINETWKAWKENRESFCVHKNWIVDQKIFVDTAKNDFDKIWLNLDSTCEVMDLPQAIKNRVLSILPKEMPKIEDEYDSYAELDKMRKKPIELRKFQQEAIEAWTKNNYRGILEMATGTGKTFTSLMAMKSLNLKSKILLIGVPQRELATQWLGVCNTVFDDIDKRIVCCYSNSGWRKNIDREIRQALRKNSLIIIIAVFGTMRKKDFLNKISSNLVNSYLIIDEVHEMGAFENRKMFQFLEGIDIRLGLSATPDRLWDNDGNEAISNFFGGKPIFSWDLQKAINPPEGYTRCLCPYKYYIHECSLTGDEIEKYELLSKKINRKIAILSSGGKIKIENISDNPSLKSLLFERAEIIKSCDNKLQILDKILDEDSNNLTKCLVYCNDKEHMAEVANIISKKGFNVRLFFGDMESEEREKVFSSFKQEDVQFIVAIKCLDQGIDLPFCNSAIILASSSNPREYVQRRGRILRPFEGKEFAIVHDIMVFPQPIDDLKSGAIKLYDYESKLLRNQLERIKIFTENSLNSSENYLKILDLGDIIMRAED